ncbi:MAG: gamma-butyrobetaine hydroxylase-like domain-containing protein [Acidiferrobacterales bacterium]
MATSKIRATDIRLHQKSRILEVAFNDESRFRFPCEYLRVYSPSAEVQGHGPGQEVLQIGKENVNIVNIEPIGAYAVRLFFDDGHDTGLYSWEWLYHLGVNQERLWNDYLTRLERAGYKRQPRLIE